MTRNVIVPAIASSKSRIPLSNPKSTVAQLQLFDIPLGLIINFNEQKLIDGVLRLILSGANLE